MADAEKKVSGNIDGAFFVDTSCIDCGACRWIDPSTFSRNDQDQASFVHVQPTEKGLVAAMRALVACPTASIGVERNQVAGTLPPVKGLFPQQVLPSVFFCGYTSESSFGAASWFVQREQGNILIDSPRWADALVKELEALGGVSKILLTHQDDVADHAKYAAHFGAERWLHKADQRQNTLEVENLVEGDSPIQIDDELTIIPTPGHTCGSMCFLWRDVLFTGDHMAFSAKLGHLYAFRGACWYSWPEVVKSLAKLLAYDFRAVLPGHGAPWFGDLSNAQAQMARCLEWARGA